MRRSTPNVTDIRLEETYPLGLAYDVFHRGVKIGVVGYNKRVCEYEFVYDDIHRFVGYERKKLKERIAEELDAA